MLNGTTSIPPLSVQNASTPTEEAASEIAIPNNENASSPTLATTQTKPSTQTEQVKLQASTKASQPGSTVEVQSLKPTTKIVNVLETTVDDARAKQLLSSSELTDISFGLIQNLDPQVIFEVLKRRVLQAETLAQQVAKRKENDIVQATEDAKYLREEAATNLKAAQEETQIAQEETQIAQAETQAAKAEAQAAKADAQAAKEDAQAARAEAQAARAEVQAARTDAQIARAAEQAANEDVTRLRRQRDNALDTLDTVRRNYDTVRRNYRAYRHQYGPLINAVARFKQRRTLQQSLLDLGNLTRGLTVGFPEYVISKGCIEVRLYKTIGFNALHTDGPMVNTQGIASYDGNGPPGHWRDSHYSRVMTYVQPAVFEAMKRRGERLGYMQFSSVFKAGNAPRGPWSTHHSAAPLRDGSFIDFTRGPSYRPLSELVWVDWGEEMDEDSYRTMIHHEVISVDRYISEQRARFARNEGMDRSTIQDAWAARRH